MDIEWLSVQYFLLKLLGSEVENIEQLKFTLTCEATYKCIQVICLSLGIEPMIFPLSDELQEHMSVHLSVQKFIWSNKCTQAYS